MESLEIKVSRKTRMVDLPRQFISVEGENLQSKLVFSFIDEFVNGQARLEYEIKGNKNYVVLDKENNTYTIPVKNVITKEGQIDMQLVITEGTDDEEIPVFKSNKFYLFCNSSINAVNEAPDGYELWIEQANVKLNQIDNLDIDIENSVITITKKDGTTKTENVKGEKGDKGDAGSVKFIIANELPTEDIDESAIYMIPAGATTDGNTYEEYIYVNGTWESLGSASVNVDLADYVKNTDHATTTTAGLVMVRSSYGIGRANSIPVLEIVRANESEIDGKTNGYKPVTPVNLDYAVKSGLTTNKLEWTDEEKQSARELIGAVSDTDVADNDNFGVVKTNNNYGIQTENGVLYIRGASSNEIDFRHQWAPITPANLEYAVGSVFPTVTQAEYDALVEAGTINEDLYYCIVEE